MSSLGFAIAFLLCPPDGSGCETVAIRAQRFDSAEACRVAIPEAMQGSGRGRSDGRRLMAACRSLDQICRSEAAAAARADVAPPLMTAGRWTIKDHCSPVRVQLWAVSQPSSAIEASMAILCGRTPEPDCSG